ncbi:MAG TPA: family 20 glycosylhydrolase [Caulobacteraceae bacterium]|nr:family 20 glycosylhydrolase [Caulobacteraceae bacterium]
MPRLAAALALAFAALAGSAWAGRVDVIPEPASVEAGTGAPVTLADGAAIATPPGDAGAARTARYLADLVFRTRGLTLRPVTRGAGVVVLERSAMDLGAEGYRLDVGGGRVTITASGDAGLFYGAVTLWQLITADEGRGAVTLDPVAIADQPRFAWRGLLLDSARHFQSPAFVERTIDWMALHKLNTLQWHLTDDQGWRIEIKTYPRLTSVGAWRIQPDRKTGRPVEYGGFYTQAQIRRIVAHAADRHVTIVPEIDMPGHSLSAIAAYPFLGSAPPAKGIRGDWGVFPFLLDPDDRTYQVMTDVLGEVMALFPSRWINVGGDEAVKDEWRASPRIQAQIKALGLPNEDALQGWFTARIAGFLAKHGRRTIGWDDILAGGEALPADTAVVSWHLDGAVRAANAGHDAVIATDPTLYLDHRQTDLPSEPPGRGAVVSIADVYAFEPAPATLPAGESAHIFGVQGNLWTEHMRTEDDVERMALPRAAAVAELGWTAPDRKDWADFERRLPAQLARYRSLGLDADMGAVSVRVVQQPAPGGGSTVALSNQLGLGQVRYTLDGSPPSAASPAYQAPIPVAAPARLRAATFVGRRAVSPELDEALDPGGPFRLRSQELQSCTNKLVLNLDAPRDAQRARPYLVDILNPCWIYPQADLTRGGRLSVSVTRLPFNFQIGAAAATIALAPPSTPDGELEVRAGCAGPLLARLPLAPAARSAGDVVLRAPVPANAGRHDLCLAFTRRKLDPMWVVGWAEYRPEAAR